MPKQPTEGNVLYIYQQLSQEIGVGRQMLLPQVEEALNAKGVYAQDFECADTLELLSLMPDAFKLTTFKGGRTYATLIPNPEWDELLEKLDSENEKAKAKSGKPWKRRKGRLVPVKPKHVEQMAAELSG